jgi:hypothetical protein
MSIVIVLAPTPETAQAAWSRLQQAGLAHAQPSRREQLAPLQVQQLMLKTAGQRRTRASAASASGAPHIALEKIWTELASDLVLGNVEHPHYGWWQALDAHTPAFWQRFDPDTRFVLVYDEPSAYPVRAMDHLLAGHPSDTDAEGAQAQTLAHALQRWHEHHSLLLDTYYALGADATLVHASQLHSAAAFAGLGAAPAFPPQAAQPPATALLHHLMQPIAQAHPAAHALWLELQAAAHGPGPAEAPAPEAAQQAIALVLQQSLAQQALRQQIEQQRQQSEELRQQTEQLQAQHTRQLRKAQEEGELLLNQLHQVQEELESHFLQWQTETQAKQAETQARQAEASAKAEAQKQCDEQAKAKSELQAQLAAETQARQAEANARAEAQKQRDEHAQALADANARLHAAGQAEQQARQQLQALDQEKTRLTDQYQHQLREAQEEGELLLLQLHQVQEELEQYFLKYQDQRQQFQAVSDFWRKHPPAEVWVDMRQTEDGHGWYEAEADGRWSGPDTTSAVALPPLGAGEYLLELQIADAMAPELVAGLQLQAVLADGQSLPVELVHEFGPADRLYPMVSTGLLQLPDTPGVWQLRLNLPEVISPATHGGDDTRQLGLRLQGLRLSLQQSNELQPATTDGTPA